jgi:hypothetical protein
LRSVLAESCAAQSYVDQGDVHPEYALEALLSSHFCFGREYFLILLEMILEVTQDSLIKLAASRVKSG